jgi:ankyrin repeat protein
MAALNDGTPPLTFAAAAGRITVIHLLAAGGANMDLRRTGERAKRAKTKTFYIILNLRVKTK